MKKLMILLIVVVVVSIFVWYAVGRKEGEGSYGPELPASAPAQKMDPLKTGNPSTALANHSTQKTESDPVIKKPPLSGKAEEEFFRSESFFKRHAASLGFFSEEELDAYRVYSVDALFSLVQSGDIKAITVLAERFVQQGDYEKAKVLYMDAAIRGSVGAIHQIIVADVSIGQGISESENREVLFQLFDEQEAWRLVLKKRGFLHPLWDDSPLNPLPWAFERRSNIDSNAIVSRAEEIYQFMTAKRHELGLGNFDNQIVEEFVGHWSRLEILADEYELPTEFQMEEAEQEQAVDH